MKRKRIRVGNRPERIVRRLGKVLERYHMAGLLLTHEMDGVAKCGHNLNESCDLMPVVALMDVL